LRRGARAAVLRGRRRMDMLNPGSLNPRVVDTYSLTTKLYLLGSVMKRMAECRLQGARTLNQFPGTLQIQTRSGCTSHCLLCPQDTISQMFPEETMDRALFNRIASEAAGETRLKALALVLQNEPLRDHDLADKIRCFQALNTSNAIVFIVTNAVLLVPDKVHELLDSGLDMMHISVNGFQREDFEAINRGRHFSVFKANLDYLLKQDLSRLGLHLSFIMNAKYRDELRSAVSYYRGMGLKVHIHGISNRGGLVDRRLIDEYRSAASAESIRNRVFKPLVKRLLPCCPYPFFQCSVLASGKVLVCTHDWSRHNIVGDLRTQSIREVWNGKALTDIRRLLLQGRMKDVAACADCNVFDDLGFV
jgi:MoaA/NifB/PqqE/SkfB family radical SAM enzyme